jgi:HTH DNA binding domain
MELPEQEVKKLGQYSAELSREVESLEVIHHLKHGTEGSAVLCKLRPRQSKPGVSELKFKFRRFEVLSEEDDGLLVYVEAEAAPLAPTRPNPPKVYLNFPFEIRSGNRRVTFLGETAEIKKLFGWLESNHVKFEVISNSDERAPPDSVIGGLTEQQRKALLSAYASGYYQVPRKVTLDTLARRDNVNKSTFAEHLLKAENRVISRVLEDENVSESRQAR